MSRFFALSLIDRRIASPTLRKTGVGWGTRRTAENQVPTLIVTAEHDHPACAEIAALLEKTVAGARKVVMPGTGHMINMERPVEFNRIVLDFLQEVDGLQD